MSAECLYLIILNCNEGLVHYNKSYLLNAEQHVCRFGETFESVPPGYKGRRRGHHINKLLLHGILPNP